jgi:hypothetical protein
MCLRRLFRGREVCSLIRTEWCFYSSSSLQSWVSSKQCNWPLVALAHWRQWTEWFQIIMATGVKVTVLCDVAACSLLETNRRFIDACCLKYQVDRPSNVPKDSHIQVILKFAEWIKYVVYLCFHIVVCDVLYFISSDLCVRLLQAGIV